MAIFIAVLMLISNPFEESGLQAEREQMVSRQIESRGVSDSLVLAAMRRVPRHLFVPAELRHHAYDDGPLAIGLEQTISQPYIVALMTELLRPDSSEKVLEIGTGSGYQAAILAEIVDTVYTIEILCPLQERADSMLKSLGYKNIVTRCADGYDGWPEAAPFDGIIVTAAPSKVPVPLLDQLKDGGKLVIPVGDAFQYLEVYTRIKDKFKKETNIPVRFVPMTGKAEEDDD